MEDRTSGRADLFANDGDPAMGANRVWFNMLRIHRSTGARIARALRDIGVGDPVWYEILLELERAGPDGLLMATLERKLFTAQYALSRHAARLEEEGWIASAAAPGPGRGKVLRLTGEGKGMHSRIWEVYQAAIAEEIGTRLSIDETYALARLLIRLYD
ncbi:MarR family winged helix-turn-helix transcriptional regulator [Oceanicola sp. 502str15]|uniref:MarR family winged helix-turn-helix transcriptional regulator n=1 Tax=Oceanicola sp. 502str15 TaxID=2696061 RepID=UPI002094062B|nr:MarR family transcriptional regulator [Oceanicola sp. 502str15]